MKDYAKLLKELRKRKGTKCTEKTAIELLESYKEMSEAIKSLIRLEEKQMNLYSHYEEIKKEQTLQEKRLDALEKEQPETKRIVGLAYKAMWMAAVAAVSFIAKTVGLI